MKSLWNDDEAQCWIDSANGDPAEVDLALRVYTSRLIGQEADLVLHGGGNTSVKTERAKEDGTLAETIHVKGSGWDLVTIEGPGLPAMWLEPLLTARDVPNMTDEEMVVFLRNEMLDQSGPNPSVEALLHAFLPAKFVDHTHSCAALAIADQPNAAELSQEIFGDELCVIPYVMPGFKLSHAADAIFQEKGEGANGLFLVNHGLFSHGDDARTSYERIIRYTDMCEQYLAEHGAALMPEEDGTKVDDPYAHAPIVSLKEALSSWDFFGEDGPFLDLRVSKANKKYLGTPDLEEVSSRGTATPDHVIRIKPRPMIGEAGFEAEDWAKAVRDYADWYEAYFERNAAKSDETKTMLDLLPRVALIRGLGIVGIGRNAKEAGVAADLAEQNARIIMSAEGIGRFTPLNEADLFELEYWSLEQAKLKKAA
ncbi:class II aldolase/adducin family protein [Roseovarius sp. MMSF_3281]|uniref:class II aldolase/adducin family protein n=1 Tax=Roseovarius sp. MMSF_3281 TaxID=3046694 RepID=UPI00273D4F1D|nr:class II aldolase/adducin family protein [Roseovarius sp. MMSF_3281]